MLSAHRTGRLCRAGCGTAGPEYPGRSTSGFRAGWCRPTSGCRRRSPTSPFPSRPSPSTAPSPQKATAILTCRENSVSRTISFVVASPSKNLMAFRSPNSPVSRDGARRPPHLSRYPAEAAGAGLNRRPRRPCSPTPRATSSRCAKPPSGLRDRGVQPSAGAATCGRGVATPSAANAAETIDARREGAAAETRHTLFCHARFDRLPAPASALPAARRFARLGIVRARSSKDFRTPGHMPHSRNRATTSDLFTSRT